EPRPLPNAATTGAGPSCDREGRAAGAGGCRGRIRRPEPHDAPIQANLRHDARPLDRAYASLRCARKSRQHSGPMRLSCEEGPSKGRATMAPQPGITSTSFFRADPTRFKTNYPTAHLSDSVDTSER